MKIITTCFFLTSLYIYAQNALIDNEIARRGGPPISYRDRSILNGRSAYRDGNYLKALYHYQEALDELPQGPIAKERRKSYVTHYAQALVQVSKLLARQNKMDQSKGILLDGLKYAPNNKYITQTLLAQSTDQFILRGRDSYRKANYRGALEHYQFALDGIFTIVNKHDSKEIHQHRIASYITHYVQAVIETSKLKQRQGKTDQSNNILLKALEYSPLSPQVMKLLRNKFPNGLPANVHLHQSLGFLRHGRSEQARDAMETFLVRTSYLFSVN